MKKFLRRSFNVLAMYCVLVFIATLWLWARSSGQVDVIGITREVLPDEQTPPDRFSCVRIGRGMVLLQRVGNDSDPWGMYKDRVPDQAHDRDVAGGHVFHFVYRFDAGRSADDAMLGYVDRRGLDHQTIEIERADFQHPKLHFQETHDIWAMPLWILALLSLLLPGLWIILRIRRKGRSESSSDVQVKEN